MSPLVSIITPTYNFQRYIEECILSVVKQTYKNWEMIIVDDASTDNTLKIVNFYLRKDKRIKLIKHRKNWGIRRLKDTYNQALKISRGKYIAILEGDDFWPSYKLEKQINSLENTNAVLSFGDCILISEEGYGFDILHHTHNKDLLENNPVGSILPLFASLDFNFAPVTVVIRKDVLMKIGGFKKGKRYLFVDFPTFLHLSIFGRFCYERKILGYWRRHSASSWFNFAKKTSAMGREEMRSAFFEFLKRNKININSKALTQIEKKQTKFIKIKRENKIKSLLLYKLLFCRSFNQVYSFAHSVLKRKQITIKIKILSFLVLFLFPLRKGLFFLSFVYKLFLYHLVTFIMFIKNIYERR